VTRLPLVRSVSQVRTLWTTSAGADPRLERVIPAVRADVVACAVVGAAEVFVTSTGSHHDGDCDRPGEHDCDARRLQVWDAATGALVRTVPGAGGRHLVTATVHGRAVAVVCDWSHIPKVVDLESGAVRDRPAGHRDIVQGLAAATLDGEPAVVSAAWDGDVRITPLTGGDVRVIETGDRLDAVAVAGSVVVAAGENVQVWDLRTGTRTGALAVASRVRGIATWPDGSTRVATLSMDGDVEVWDTATGAKLGDAMPRRRMTLAVTGIVAADGHHLIAVADHEAVHLAPAPAPAPAPAEAEAEAEAQAEAGAGPPLLGATSWCGLASPGPGRLATVSDPDATLAVWRIGAAGPQPRGSGHTSTITCVTTTPGGRIVAGGTDGTVGSWELADGTRGPVVGALPAPVHAVAVSGHEVLAGGGDMNGSQDNDLHRWLGAGPDRPVHVDHHGVVRIVVPAVLDGRPIVLTGGAGATVRVTDAATGERLGGIPGHHQPDGIGVGVLAGRPVAAISRTFGPFQLWDLAAGAPIETPLTGAMEVLERVHAVAGPVIVTVRGHVVRIRGLDSDLSWHLDPGNGEVVTAIAVSDDGGAVAVARRDGSVSVPALAPGAAADVLTLPYPATALAWAPGGDLIIACRRDLLRVGRPAAP
jgi:WD40 repeat protein